MTQWCLVALLMSEALARAGFTGGSIVGIYQKKSHPLTAGFLLSTVNKNLFFFSTERYQIIILLLQNKSFS